MIEMQHMVHEIEHKEEDHINIEWQRGSAKVFNNKKPVELHLKIRNDPETYLSQMERKHNNELRKGFKWPVDSLSQAIKLGREITKYYGCNEDLPTPIVDESQEIYLAAQVIYRGCN